MRISKLIMLVAGIASLLLNSFAAEAGFYDDNDFDGSDLAVFSSEIGVCTNSCDGDFVGDGDVDQVDFGFFASSFGGTNCQPPEVITEIGPEGGVAEVTEPESDIFGCKVTVPEGAFEGNVNLVISAESSLIDLPECLGYAGKGIVLETDPYVPIFGRLLEVEIPYSGIGNVNNLGVVNYIEKENRWAPAIITGIDEENRRVSIATYHFTRWNPIEYLFCVNEDSVDTYFNPSTDRFPVGNYSSLGLGQGKCWGMVKFSKWWFLNKKAEALFSSYSKNVAINIV